MKAAVAGSLLCLLVQADVLRAPTAAEPEHMRYERAVRVPAGQGQACAAFDAPIFPHAGPSLKDVRIFRPEAGSGAGGTADAVVARREVPYAITVSDTETKETDQARVRNLELMGGKGSSIAFDLEMPPRAYSDVVLDLAGKDFVAVAAVSGVSAPGGRETGLGAFTLFDLSSEHLSRDTTLPLEESRFPYLHVVLTVRPAAGAKAFDAEPGMVRGASVPPSRIDQMIFTPVAEAAVAGSGGVGRAEFFVPARVPVERVSFVPQPGFKGNFSGEVRITATPQPGTKPVGAANAAGDEIAAGADLRRGTLPEETVTGTFLRVHATEAGREIRAERLSVPAVLGANLQSPERVEVEIASGGAAALPAAAVRLEMRQRKICFDAAAAGRSPVLYYGDPALETPAYEYDRFFTASPHALEAELGPEQLNPDYRPEPAVELPLTKRHPEAVWVGVIVAICLLGMVALRSSRNVAAR